VVFSSKGTYGEEDQHTTQEEEDAIKQISNGLNIEVGVRNDMYQPYQEKNARQHYE